MANIETFPCTLKVAGTANTTATAFPSVIPTTTEPTAFCFEPLRNDVLIVPYAQGADDRTLSMRVIGWSKVPHATTPLWVPTVINQFDLVLSTAVGVAGTPVDNTHRFADTITASTTVVGDDVFRVSSPGSNLIGHVVVSRDSFEKVQISFSGTAANALYSEL